MRRLARPLVALLAPTVGALAFAQTATSAPPVRDSLFTSVKPDATIVVSEHPTGSDLVTITVRRGDHPLPDLRAACEQVGQITGVPVRGLYVTSTNPASPNGFPKATFATDGLIVREDPRLRLAPLIRAFGFGRTPLRNLAVIYSGESANSKTMRRWDPNDDHSLRVEAQLLPGGNGFPGAIEYRTAIAPGLTEAGVVFPGAKGTMSPQAQPVSPPTPRDYTLPLVFGIGALALGGLVYSVLLRPRSGAARRPSGR